MRQLILWTESHYFFDSSKVFTFLFPLYLFSYMTRALARVNGLLKILNYNNKHVEWRKCSIILKLLHTRHCNFCCILQCWVCSFYIQYWLERIIMYSSLMASCLNQFICDLSFWYELMWFHPFGYRDHLNLEQGFVLLTLIVVDRVLLSLSQIQYSSIVTWLINFCYIWEIMIVLIPPMVLSITWSIRI